MAKKKSATAADDKQITAAALALSLSQKAIWQKFGILLVGATPLICHAWSEKAKRDMLGNQAKATRAGKEARNPDQDFVDSLYEMDEGSGRYGFPVTGIKKCLLSSAHKDKNVPRTEVRGALWLDHEIISVQPAHKGAKCNLPLVQIWGPPPVMREDMVRIGAGLNKKANLAYRGEFWPWAIWLSGRFNTSLCSNTILAMLVDSSGIATGIGDWRNEKDGIFGAFRQSTIDELKAWQLFHAGQGPLPPPGQLFFDDEDEKEAA